MMQCNGWDGIKAFLMKQALPAKQLLWPILKWRTGKSLQGKVCLGALIEEPPLPGRETLGSTKSLSSTLLSQSGPSASARSAVRVTLELGLGHQVMSLGNHSNVFLQMQVCRSVAECLGLAHRGSQVQFPATPVKGSQVESTGKSL